MTTSGGRGYREIDLLDIVRAVRKRIVPVMLAAILCGAGAYLLTRFALPPVYEVRTTLYAYGGAEGDRATGSDVSAAQGLAETYAVLLEDPAVRREILDRSGAVMTETELADRMTARAVDKTGLILVTVRDRDPSAAKAVADAVDELLPEKADLLAGSGVRLLARAELPTEPVGPDTLGNTLLGAALGLILGIGAVTLGVLRDDRVRDPARYLRTRFRLPVLAELDAGAADYALLGAKLALRVRSADGCAVLGLTAVSEGETAARVAAGLAAAWETAGETVAVLREASEHELSQARRTGASVALASLPPIAAGAAALTAAGRLDNLVLLVPEGCSKQSLGEAAERLALLGERALGFVALRGGEGCW